MPPPGTRPGTGRETRVTCTTTKDTPPAEALSVERPTDPFHSANLVRETFEPVMRLRCPSILPCPRHQAIARIMRDDHQATAHLGLNCLLSTLSSLLSRPSSVSSLLPRNPDTTDARFPGQGRHKGRSQDADAGDIMGSFQLESLNPNRSTLAITSRQSTRPPRNPRPASLARSTRLD